MGKLNQTLYKKNTAYVFLRELFKPCFDYMSLALHRTKWRKKNRHNYTFAINKYPIDKVNVGKGTYGGLCVYSFRHTDEHLSIGSYCSIGGQVSFLLGGNHPLSLLSTFPFANLYHKPNFEIIDNSTKGPISIGSDVWIGHNVTILSGVTIGQGAVIGAGSIVTKDVPAYAVFLGNKVAKYRFDKEIIEELIKIDFEKITDEQFQLIEPLMYEQMTIDIAQKIVNLLTI